MASTAKWGEMVGAEGTTQSGKSYKIKKEFEQVNKILLESLTDTNSRDKKLSVESNSFKELFPQFVVEVEDKEEQTPTPQSVTTEDMDIDSLIEEADTSLPEAPSPVSQKKKKSVRKAPVPVEVEEPDFEWKPWKQADDFYDKIELYSGAKKAIFFASQFCKNPFAKLIYLTHKHDGKLKMDYQKFVQLLIVNEQKPEVQRPEETDFDKVWQFMGKIGSEEKSDFTDEDYLNVLSMVAETGQEYIFLILDSQALLDGWGSLGIKEDWLEPVMTSMAL
ncbi:hypothetical protein ThvES_00013380 [Thiovulum sp. ES]|nr:hypothetical protein ThvES_00013380 [Thiovulum sp. ES]